MRPTTGGEGAVRATQGEGDPEGGAPRGAHAVRATQGEGASLRPTTGGEGAALRPTSGEGAALRQTTSGGTSTPALR